MKKAFLISFAALLLAVTSNAQTEPAKPTSSSPFSEEAEAGIVAANGNTKSQSYLLKNTSSYKFEAYLAKFTGSYFRTMARDYDTQFTTDDEKWDLGLRLERDVTEKLGVFVAQIAESDEAMGIDRRYNSDLGARYMVVKHEGYYTQAELGYRFSKEEYIDNRESQNYNLARIYLESEKQWSPACSTKFWVEYLPNFDEPKDYNINSEVSVSAAINNDFSVKTAYSVKYDNVPAADYKTDTMFTTSLLAKF